MGLFGSWGETAEAQHNAVYNGEPHEGSLFHELIGGAAAFYAMKQYQAHEAANGKPVSHAFAKEMLAAIAAAEVEKLAETKGMDEVTKLQAKRHAEEQANQMYDASFGQQAGIPQA